ncbi:Transcription factor bHLH25, partial [Striga hermonthica]
EIKADKINSMNSSVISRMSPLVMHNPIFTGPCENLSIDDDFVALLGQDFGNYLLSPRTNSSSCSSALIDNITPSNNMNSNNTFYTSFSLEQHKMLRQAPDSYSGFPNMINQGCMINYPADHNPSQNIQQLQVQLNLEKVSVGPDIVMAQGSSSEGDVGVKAEPTKKKGRIRGPSQSYDHIIAERKRREQLNQLFVALSALVPGLKKMDKSSVLEDAIKYLKHLKETVQDLEAKAEKHAMESVVLVKKSHITVEDEQSLTVEEKPLPEIEARWCENLVLLKVHCEMQKGVLVKLVSKIESMNMIVINTNATPFGNVTLNITIVAEMEKEFKFTLKEVVTAIRGVV